MLPEVWIIYGGVFPTYHWREILVQDLQIDIIVRREGEEAAPRLIAALESRTPLRAIRAIAFHDKGVVVGTAPAPLIADRDTCRVGWEPIDHRRYSYWGGKRAVVVQFSRDCPHPCNSCGQHGFWTRFRHRDPKKFAAEIARQHREHGVEVIIFADENPSAARKAWRAVLDALTAENVALTLVGSTRADDIVRDADILHAYKKAGFQRLLGPMSRHCDSIRSGGGTATDREAIRPLRQHAIVEETDRDLLRGLRQLLSYGPDPIQTLYVDTAWTPFFRIAADRGVIQTDQRPQASGARHAACRRGS